MALRLPPGPTEGRLAQTVVFHRDPVNTLRRAQERYGPVFTLRFATAGPTVVVAAPAEAPRLAGADPEWAQAGAARRAVLPLASPRSVFGADGPLHRAARATIAPAFAPETVERHVHGMAALAHEHVGRWPVGRPFRLLPRMRLLAEEIVVRLVIGVDDPDRGRAVATAVRRALRTPGNPPLDPPGEGDGVLGIAGRRLFERRLAPVTELLQDELAARRGAGEADDVIGLLLRAEPGLSASELVDRLAVVLAAGQEPPSIALTSVLGRLARAPGLTTRLRAEPASPELLEAAIDETLRLRPPALASLRQLTAASEIAGVSLPANATVMVPIPLIHRDPDTFPEPEAFDPTRFLERPRPPTFMPFGGGARRCIAEPLARAMLRTVVPVVMSRLELRPVGPPERLVQRATVLVPQRSELLVARPR
jgi:cytochrome P450